MLNPKNSKPSDFSKNHGGEDVCFGRFSATKEHGSRWSYRVLGAHFGLAGDWSYDHGRAVAMQILAVSAFMGAGNAMNDIKDAMIDAKAHPSRPLPSGRITETQAIRFVWLLMLFSVGSMLVGVFNLQSKGLDWWPFAVIYVVAVMLMLTYDLGPKTKARGLIGNIAISLMVAAVIAYGAASIGKMTPLVGWIAHCRVFHQPSA